MAAEHLRLGNWDLIKGYTGCTDADIEPRIVMQIVNEAVLCSNRVRKSNYITHQGFELLNGLGFLVTDGQVHDLNALILADKEHFTEYLIRSIDQDSGFEFLVPAISTERIHKIDASCNL
jgi:hypothetical protein